MASPMGAAEDWDRLVAGIPQLRDSLDALGTRGGDRRSRARRRAAEMDASRLTLADIAWSLQEAAADGEARSRVAAAHARHRHDARSTAARTPPLAGQPIAPLAGGSASPGRTAGFVIALILAFLAPALVMPRFRGGGFVYDVDQVALLSGVASLTIAVVGLVSARRAAGPLFGAAVPLIVAVWVVIGAVVATVRVVENPVFASPSTLTGIVLMGIAVALHVLAVFVRRSAADRSTAAIAAAVGGSADELAAALAGEAPDAALVRRVAYADGILTLMKRGELDVHDAEHLLRDYAC